jgi:hypothetical protein
MNVAVDLLAPTAEGDDASRKKDGFGRIGGGCYQPLCFTGGRGNEDKSRYVLIPNP